MMLENWTLSVFVLFICALFDPTFCIPWPPKADYFVQRVDHFSFQAANLTFRQRYLYENKWYKPNGPIFFYCGNEGDIETFWNNTGLMFEMAPSFNAFILFAEHNYHDADPKCSQKIKDAFNTAVEMSKKPDPGYKQLSEQLRLCQPISNEFEFYWALKWARNAFVMMAMGDYPYQASFVGSLPAYPVNVSCKNALVTPDLIPSLREAVAVYYNSSMCKYFISYMISYILLCSL
ncbi:unnamed protein product [Trichobilharzia regenti]|nr:unnamed protein product [Trichobilharzia regenti]